MPPNCLLQRQGLQIVQKSSLGAQAPQWSSPQFIRCVMRPHLNDPVTCSYVVQKKIAERMNDLVTESFRNREHAFINDGSRRSCGERWHMARCTADASE